MDIDILCFKIKNEIICVNKFAYNYINLSKKHVKYLLTREEYTKILEELYQRGEELPIIDIENHRYSPRIYYRIYTIYLEENKQKTFMEIFDGVSGMYEYVFCNSKKKCLQVMKTREEGNEMMY